MLAKQTTTVSRAGSVGCRKPTTCHSLVIRAQLLEQRSCATTKVSSRRSVLFGAASVAAGMMLVPAAAEAKLVDLNRQRREQEMMYAPELKRLDDMMMQQLKAKQAESRGLPGASRRAARRNESE